MSLSLRQKSLASEYKPHSHPQTQRVYPQAQRLRFRVS